MTASTPNAPGEEAGAGRLAREIAALQAALLGRLREELAGEEAEPFAAAAQRLAEEFGAVAATAIGALREEGGAGVAASGAQAAEADAAPADDRVEAAERHADLYRPGAMRRRLEQLIETHRRYGHPFGLAVFDAEGPGTRSGDPGGGRATVQTVVGAALHESVRLVDETFRLEEGALCVLAPNQDTVGGVQMAERLLGMLDELEAAGGMRVEICAGVVACPEHGTDAEGLLHSADEAMWRARAVGQPLGVGALREESLSG